MAGIFISYRQADAKAWAIGLRDDLAKAFGDDHVFLDKDALGPGNWRDQLQRALERCSVVLVVIGKQWLTTADEQNRPRISLPGDVHRHEIALALSYQGVTVIPVLVDEATMPKADQLPEDIRGLTNQQAYKIGDTKARRKTDVEVLVKGIVAIGGLVTREPMGEEERNRSSKDKPSWYKLDYTAGLLSFGLTILVSMVWESSEGLTLPEKVFLLGFFYVLIVMGKLLCRYFASRGRRVA
ncbi:MAG: toll/interleukin-1 receptor domain-containing protein [Nitrospira sp.]|nr:toll/interleukin-1 receptor domain-containing protein [Nitrospira sp.]